MTMTAQLNIIFVTEQMFQNTEVVKWQKMHKNTHRHTVADQFDFKWDKTEEKEKKDEEQQSVLNWTVLIASSNQTGNFYIVG